MGGEANGLYYTKAAKGAQAGNPVARCFAAKALGALRAWCEKLKFSNVSSCGLASRGDCGFCRVLVSPRSPP